MLYAMKSKTKNLKRYYCLTNNAQSLLSLACSRLQALKFMACNTCATFCNPTTRLLVPAMFCSYIYFAIPPITAPSPFHAPLIFNN